MSDSWIVNYAGRQRFQSQEIVKNILLLSREYEIKNKSFYLDDLNRVLEIWEKYHYQLKSGDLKDLGIKVNNSDTIQLMFARIDPYFTVILKNAKLIRKHYLNQQMSGVNAAKIQKGIAEILANEMKFLKGMDQIVFQFDKEAKAKVSTLKKVELSLLLVTLFILFLEGIFIFRPIVKQVKTTIEKLIFSEQNAIKNNERLKQLNQSLKIAEEELLNATREKYQQIIEQQKIRAASLIEGQEEERKRLARELHDGLGQMLTALKLNAENIDFTTLPDNLRKTLIDQKELIKETISSTRSISFNLMPAALNDFGLDSALKILVKQITAHTNVQVKYHSDINAKRLDKNIEIGLYRVAQEGINNAMKYAQADEIEIHLGVFRGLISLSISDNGKGFNYRRTKNTIKNGTATQGISNMKERINLLGGHLRIVTKPGEGTKILIKIPTKTNVQNKSFVS